jgi:hypothetical protein
MSVHSTTIHPLCFYPSLAPAQEVPWPSSLLRPHSQRSAETLRFAVEPLTTYNLWHTITSIGPAGVISAGATDFRICARCAPSSGRSSDAHGRFAIPFQTWIMIAEEDARHDAVYVHSLNSNGAPFPFHPKEVEASALRAVPSSTAPGTRLARRLEPSPRQIRRVDMEQPHHWVWVQGVGIPLWAG